jgi:hypothetical protein
VADFSSDIPVELARAAHSGTSFTPDVRAEQERSGYAATLAKDFANLSRYATTDEKRAQLAEEFERYRTGYRRRYLVYLGARSRCMSSMIAGPSNFPTARNQKRNASADRRSDDLQSFRERALKAITKALTPELQPIASGASDAVERLRAEIAKATSVQERMRAANAAIRKHAKGGADAQVAALVAFGFSEAMAREVITPDCMGRIGFADYQLKNNGANVRRMQQRLAEVERAKSTADTVTEGGDGIRVEDSPADNRVRLFFPGKPADDVRADLKAHGFRWAPSLGCWQAYRNHRALTRAQRFAAT